MFMICVCFMFSIVSSCFAGRDVFFRKHVATYASDEVMVHAKDVKPFGQLEGGDLCPDFVNRTVGPFLRGTSHLYYIYYLSGVD